MKNRTKETMRLLPKALVRLNEDYRINSHTPLYVVASANFIRFDCFQHTVQVEYYITLAKRFNLIINLIKNKTNTQKSQ